MNFLDNVMSNVILNLTGKLFLMPSKTIKDKILFFMYLDDFASFFLFSTLGYLQNLLLQV